jgi:hypothetical protein
MELVISITLTAILVAVVFSAWQRTRLNEERFDEVKKVEKEIYVLYHSFNGLFKNTSSVKVFFNLNRRSFFVGRDDSVVLITREPLVAPRRTLHFVDIREENGNLVYQERRMQGLPEEQRPGADMFSSSSPEKLVLLEGIDDFSLRYRTKDDSRNKFLWRDQLYSLEKEEFPDKVEMSFTYKGQEFQYVFSVLIRDRYDKIPPQFLK